MPKPLEKSEPALMKIPPHNLEAEQTILGSILINNDAMNRVVDILSTEDFYREAHAFIYEGMVQLYNQGEPIDIITLSQTLKKKELLPKIGDTDYIASLVEAVSTSAGIAHHAEIVKNLSLRRKLINECSRISESCFRDWEETDDLLETAEQSIFDIAEDKAGQGFLPLKDVMKQSFKRLESIAEHEGFVTGIPTDFIDFDQITAGLQPSDLIIIAGRPSMGKTALALNIAYNAAKRINKGIAVFSLEMSKMQLGLRMLGFDAMIDSKNLRSGSLKDNDWRKLIDSAEHLSNLPLYIDDTSSLSVLEMKARCRRLKKMGDLGLVVVDYLQLVQGKRNVESRQQEISEISRSLKALAKDLNVPVLALSQLNRKVEERHDKQPQLADLRESGAIEQDADVIAFIYKEDPRSDAEDGLENNVVNVKVAKQRNGPTGVFKLTFQKEYTRFRDYTSEEPVF